MVNMDNKVFLKSPKSIYDFEEARQALRGEGVKVPDHPSLDIKMSHRMAAIQPSSLA